MKNWASLQIQRFSLYKQIELFQGMQEVIRGKIGKRAAQKFFQEARYVVALGSNDFINNYLMPVYADSWTYNDDTFMGYLIGTLRDQLKVFSVYSNTNNNFFLSFFSPQFLASNNKNLFNYALFLFSYFTA